MSKKQTILLIGGTGFIGRNIIDSMLKDLSFANTQIVVVSRHEAVVKEKNIIYKEGSYGDIEFMDKLFLEWKFEKVFHLASTTIPVSSNINIIDDLQTNLLVTINLLEVMRKHDCKFILYMSSGGAVYGENKPSPISENEICFPISSYGVVKLSIENYLRLYQKQFGINYLILRISNPFGEFHVSEKQGVINIAVRRAVKGLPLEIWGDGNQAKDYIYISDLTMIVLKLINKNILNQTINIGSGNSFQLNFILNEINKVLPLKINYVESLPTDVRDFCLDITLLQSLIDFEVTNFNTAINNTIAWEKSQI